MSRYSLVFSALVLTLTLCGCIGRGHDDRAAEDQAMQDDIDAEVAACRCRFQVDNDDEVYDIPCGTTYCLGVAPMRCGADGAFTQLPTECDSHDHDKLIPAVCRQDYPGDYPIDCASITNLGECESYGGCLVEAALCNDASFGCEGFVSTL